MTRLPEHTRLAALVASARQRKGLTQHQTAEMLGITRTYLSKIENAKAPGVSYELVRRITMRLEINLDVWLPPPPYQTLEIS